jgi:hypothetical protein
MNENESIEFKENYTENILCRNKKWQTIKIVSYRSNYLSNYKKLSNNNHKVIDKLYEII